MRSTTFRVRASLPRERRSSLNLDFLAPIRAWRTKFRHWQPRLRHPFPEITEMATVEIQRPTFPGFDYPTPSRGSASLRLRLAASAGRPSADRLEGRPNQPVRTLRRVACAPWKARSTLRLYRSRHQRRQIDSKRSFPCTAESNSLKQRGSFEKELGTLCNRETAENAKVSRIATLLPTLARTRNSSRLTHYRQNHLA